MADGISYHNKDILMKVLSQNYMNKSFEVFGLDLPKIKQMLPTNLPKVKATELRVDNIFLLEDDRILITDYESTVNNEDFFKYIDYVSETLKAYYKLENKIYNIVVAIIYTGDILKAPDTFAIDCMQFSVKQVFLSRFDTSAIYEELRCKVEAKEQLTDEELMKFIVLPLTEPTKERKQQLIEKTVSLAKSVEDERQQVFLIAGILVATDKFIDREYSDSIKEWISMTKVARLFEEEKIEAVNQAANQAFNQGVNQGLSQGINQGVNLRSRSIALEMLRDGEDALKIMKYTGLTKDEILQIQKEQQNSIAN